MTGDEALAVLEDAEGKFVMLYENGIAAKTRVETGIECEGFIQISSGIVEGQEVIYEGNFGLSSGSRVKLMKDSDK